MALPAPRFRHVLVLSVAQTVTWGTLYYSFAVLLPAMERAGVAGATTLGAAFSLALAVAGLLAVPVGTLLDRYGARLVLCAGTCAGAVTLLTVASSSSPPLLFAAFVLLGAAHAGALYEPALAAVVAWFGASPRRDRAIVVLTSVAGLASTIFVPLTAVLSERLGWRGAAVTFALCLGLGAVPLFASLPPHRATPPVPRGPRAPAPWLLGASMALHAAATVPMTIYLFSLLVERGHTATIAAAAVGAGGAAQVAVRLVFLLRLRLPRRLLTPSLLVAQAATVAGVALASSAAAVIAFVAAFGAANGLMTLVRSAASADWYGGPAFGARNGALAAGAVAGRAVAPLLVGSAMDAGRSPALIFTAAGGALLAAAAVWLGQERANSASAASNG